jgi:hypothetical protein
VRGPGGAVTGGLLPIASRALADRARLRDLATELRWEPTRYELSRLVEALSEEIARNNPRRWR